ncbi:DUF3857 domain-containing protein [Saccharicrinis sp. FJH54]|uniref:DUF3857 domain-containing protein n=1 Tax=Saccharicrinis sp. FJH54 TaxID=3344665 RepID=UPI0035D40A42
MKKLFLLLFLASQIIAQAKGFETTDWETSPDYKTLPDSLMNENVICLNLNIAYDFRHGDDGNLYAYETEHKVYRILNEESIQSFNKYYMYDESVLEYITIKARTISSDGTIKEFDKSNIKEITDEETGKKYKIFAVDGIEEGNTVEYFTVMKKEAESFGRNYFQFGFPVLEASYSLTCPEKLRYLIKPYNGHMTQSEPEIKDSTVYYSLTGENIPAINSELFSYLNPNKVRVEYRLDRNLFKGKYQLNTWDIAAKIINNQFSNLNKKEEAALEKFVKKLKVPNGENIDKIIAVENIIKKDFLIQEQNSYIYNDLTFTIGEKVSSDKGLAKLYANIFTKLNIPYNVVLTCERDNVKFDKSFPSWNYLTTYLIYFPEYDLYLTPSMPFLRVGMTKEEVMAQNALFIRKVSVGNFHSAVADIKYIEENSYLDNQNNIISDITLDVENNKVNIDLTKKLKGLSGGYFELILSSMDEDQKLSTFKNLSGLDDLNPEFSDFKIIDQNNNKYQNEFGLNCKVSTPGLIENAGNKILFKMGMVIGPQAELYQEAERTLPVENQFNRSYDRILTFNVPEGYKISNPEAGIINVVSSREEDPPYGFISEVEYSGNTYTIKIHEFYKDLLAPIEQFEAFRRVVNAAADFNKVVLVLEKTD